MSCGHSELVQQTSANCCLALQWFCTLFMFILCLSHYSVLTVAHHRQEHIFPDFSPLTFKFPNFSMFSRLMATLIITPTNQRLLSDFDTFWQSYTRFYVTSYDDFISPSLVLYFCPTWGTDKCKLYLSFGAISLTWLQSSSIRRLTVPWIIRIHSGSLLSVFFLYPYLFTEWCYFNHVFIGLPLFLFHGNVPRMGCLFGLAVACANVRLSMRPSLISWT